MDLQSEKTGSTPKTWLWLGLGCLLLLCCGLIVGLAGVLLVVPIVRQPVSTGFPNFGLLPSASPTLAPLTLTETTSNVLGSASAPVKIIEYSDFQCPYCERFWRETEPQIIANYVETGKVRLIYRSLGAFLGPESGAAAEAAYCAGDQEKFWQYHDALFAHQGGENSGAFSNDVLLGLAQSLKLDIPTFSACLSEGKYRLLVEKDATDGQATGVNAVPAFLINGELITGAHPYDVFAEAIEAALAGK